MSGQMMDLFEYNFGRVWSQSRSEANSVVVYRVELIENGSVWCYYVVNAPDGEAAAAWAVAEAEKRGYKPAVRSVVQGWDVGYIPYPRYALNAYGELEKLD